MRSVGIVDSLESALEAAKCEHAFEYLKPHPMASGLTARCRRCQCRLTAWPGTIHYDEIVAARDLRNSTPN